MQIINTSYPVSVNVLAQICYSRADFVNFINLFCIFLLDSQPFTL